MSTVPTLPSAEVITAIPFYDVDPMEVAWHGHYPKYFELARSALMDRLAYNYVEMRDSGFAWPIIEMNIKYAKPVLFGSKIRIEAKITEYEMRLKVAYRIFDLETEKRLTRAYTIQAAVALDTGEMQYRSPNILFEKLGVSPCETNS